ncbi:unnamed protein product, partial [Mesorhabditis belari]|uniref:Uncharacterized protein n=1 Tax=Mesorhabditis belari TaxID=2138241 RepID=A0AAF3F7W3_9BILA
MKLFCAIFLICLLLSTSEAMSRRDRRSPLSHRVVRGATFDRPCTIPQLKSGKCTEVEKSNGRSKCECN